MIAFIILMNEKVGLWLYKSYTPPRGTTQNEKVKICQYSKYSGKSEDYWTYSSDINLEMPLCRTTHCLWVELDLQGRTAI